MNPDMLSKISGAGCDSAQRENHHVRIDAALFRLEVAISDIYALRDQICGEGNEADSQKMPPRPVPTLASTLQDAPDRINQAIVRIESVVGEIRERLF